MSKEYIMVAVLHKQFNPATDHRHGLAVGKTFVFPKTKDAYTVQLNGSVIRGNPNPWKNKADRKKYLRQRRVECLAKKELV